MKKDYRPGAAATLSLSVVFLAGCAWGFGGPDDAITDMHRQFSRTGDVQTAVVLGDLERARASGTWLATHEDRGPLPTGADPYRAQMKGYAALIGQAQTLASAAAQTGWMAAACGDCHQATGAGPRFVVQAGPPEATTPGSRMVRHLWAADRMWEGLVGPSDEAWLAGARALGTMEASPATALLASTSPQGSPLFSARISDLAAAAASARDQEGRALVYGQLLDTCTRCHSGAGVLTQR